MQHMFTIRKKKTCTKNTSRIMTFLMYTYILESVKMPNTELYEETQSPNNKFICNVV